ncbi:hypothetical protein Tco_0144090 [Tanacetum coccineum]
MVPFIKELGYTGKCDMLSEIHTDHMHQPWRTFAVVINRCISGMSTCLDRLRPSRDQILWGTFYKKNVDFVALLWEVFMFQADNREISFAPTPKKARKFKKPASPSKRQTLVLKDEPAKKPRLVKHPEPAKKFAPAKEDVSSKKPSRKKSAGVVIRDTPALLEAAQLKKVLKRSKQDTYMLHTSGSDDGVGSQPKVPDELQDKTTGTNEGTGTIPGVPDVPKDQSESENESWGESGDDDDSNDDDNDDDSDDDGNNVENAEPADKEKDDEDITVAGHVNVNQEGEGNQVKDDAQATQKMEGPIPKKDVKELKTVDHSASLLSTIKYEVPNAVKEYLGTSLDDALYKVLKKHDADIIKEHSVLAEIKAKEPKETITSSDTTALKEFDQKTTLFETMTKSKSFNKSPKQRALYHALMELILEDEDAMDEGVADKLKKRKQDDVDKDEGPFARSDRGLKRRKQAKILNHLRRPSRQKLPKVRLNLTKSTNKFAQEEEIVFEAGDTQEPQNQGHNMGNTDDRPNVKAAPKHDWKIAQAEKPPLSFDELMSTPIDYSSYVMNHLKINKLTQEHLVGPTFNLLKGTCKSRKEYPFDLSKPLLLIMLQGPQVVPVDHFINNDLEYLRGGSSSKKYTTSTIKTKAAKYDIPGIKDMVPSL